jgi:nicotinate-nucleotide pyrophosphorylase (carboxylating)
MPRNGPLPALPAPLIEQVVRAALCEDLGRAGDITSAATIPAEETLRATIAARHAGVLCGLALAESAFRQLDPAVRFEPLAHDGDHLKAGQAVARVAGPARAVLSAERVALNFLTHLSGVATATAAFASAIAHTKARITCTRKTIPGLRALQKYAVRCGGGSSHRFGLDDAILIKDNHIAVCGSVRRALERAKSWAGHLVKIEIEVDSLDQLREAIEAGADAVLLDNMEPEVLEEAVRLADGQVVLEASGKVTLVNVAAISETGVDYISSGWITHSAPSLDLGLDFADR